MIHWHATAPEDVHVVKWFAIIGEEVFTIEQEPALVIRANQTLTICAEPGANGISAEVEKRDDSRTMLSFIEGDPPTPKKPAFDPPRLIYYPPRRKRDSSR